MNKNKSLFLLASLFLFLLCIGLVSAGTLTAVDPTNSDTISGANYFLNYTFQLNSSNGNATQSMVFLHNGTTIIRLATNGTMNVSMNASGYVSVLMAINTTALTEQADYTLLSINVSTTTPAGSVNNDTLRITSLDIDNTAPTATVSTQMVSAIIGGLFTGYCGLSTDGVDTALTANISLWKSDGSILSSITNTDSATGTETSSTAEFLNGLTLTEPGEHQLNCRVTDDAGFSTTSSNLSVLFKSKSKSGQIATQIAKGEAEDTAFNSGLLFLFGGLALAVIVIFVTVFMLIKKQKRR